MLTGGTFPVFPSEVYLCPMFKLSRITVFPVKSLRGIDLDAADLTERGLRYDRRWMVVDERGHFLTQREVPEMATIWTEIEGDTLLLHHEDPYGGPPLHLPLEPAAGKQTQVQVWKNKVSAQGTDPAADSWITTVLRRNCRLVFMPDSTNRIADPKYTPEIERVSFADGFPYLLCGEAALADLNGRLEAPVPMDRFRPNLVFAGGEAFGEDSWEEFRIGTARFRAVKPCSRCTMTTHDPITGERRDKEPLRTLATYRKQDGKVLFGQNLVLVEGENVKVGDEIKIISTQ